MPLASPKYPFQAWAINGAPDDPGLYALYDGDEVICIGIALASMNADTIRGRLFAHLHSAAGTKPTHYRWEISSNPLSLRARYLAYLGRAAMRCEDAKTLGNDAEKGIDG